MSTAREKVIKDNYYKTKAERVEEELDEVERKLEVLKNLDLFVLDNTLRETTVGQLRGHTISDKWKLYNQAKNVGFEYNIVASFSHWTRVGDQFIQQLHDSGEDMSKKFAFSEVSDEAVNEYPSEELPVGLKKCKELKINNVFFELDLVYYAYNYNKFTVENICRLLDRRFKWVRENLSKDSMILVNIRDLPDCMNLEPERCLKVVNYMANYYPPIFGIAFEESGKFHPEKLGIWTRACREEMQRVSFKGHFLVHVHQAWGMLDVTQLECLANGCDGIWAGLCEEGASMGHASSCLTIMNLVRYENKKVREKFKCEKIRDAAIEATKVTTGLPPHPKQPVYGARALDQVFGLPQFDEQQKEKKEKGGGTKTKKEFSLTEYLGVEAVQRITTLADDNMITTRLRRLFGEDAQFTLKLANRMKELMLDDLNKNIKEEYHSPVGLAVLFDRAGGKLTKEMADAIAKYKPQSLHIQGLIDEIRKQWDEWDLKDGTKDDYLEFNAFYNGFMGPYFGCYRCKDTKLALRALDMDEDGKVDWNEFAVYLKWAGKQYPQTKDAQSLLDIAFREGLIPSMQLALIDITQDDSPKNKTRLTGRRGEEKSN